MPINKIGLGTVQFGLPYGISNINGQTTTSETAKIISYAKTVGIETLDSASAYGNAEEVIGNIGVAEFKVVSKFISPKNEKDLEEQLFTTLKNLKIKKLYGYLAHRPEELLHSKCQWEKIQEFKEKGIVQKIGFSLNYVSELDHLLANNFTPDLIQVPFNFFDQRFENHMAMLKGYGCEIHTRSTFLQGLFFRSSDGLPEHFDFVKPLLDDLQNNQINLVGSLLRFVVDKPFIDKVIIGVETIDQLQMNLLDLAKGDSLEVKNFNIPEIILVPALWPKQ
jgi:aryl-alcohol dehydrogenase-like predicted oxidoreductase